MSKSRPASNHGFAKRLKHLRTQKSMSAAILAKLLGVTSPAVWAWENNGATPRKSTLDAIAKTFDTSPEFLLTGKTTNGASIDKENVPSIVPSDERPLEELMRAIESRGFRVSVTLKTE